MPTRFQLRLALPAALAVAVLAPGGCSTAPPEPRADGSRARDLLEAALAGSMSDESEWNSTWGEQAAALADPLADLPESVAAAAESGPVWSIVLNTFSGDDHRQAAATMVAQLPQVSPQLRDAWVQPKENGSIVAYGRYDGPADPAAQRDLKQIKALAMNGRRIFPRAMLSRVQRGSTGSSPYQLISVRERYPNIDELWSLQIALWGAFKGAMPWPEAQRRAEADVRALRAQGLPAYVHHDPDQEFSSVTIGLFDHRALNTRSGLYSPEVEALLRRFPRYLINGQPVTNPATGEDQEPKLVVVPKR